MTPEDINNQFKTLLSEIADLKVLLSERSAGLEALSKLDNSLIGWYESGRFNLGDEVLVKGIITEYVEPDNLGIHVKLATGGNFCQEIWFNESALLKPRK